MTQLALTTIDNPFDPFTEFSQWFSYDVSKGYNTCALLDRIAFTSELLSDEENFKQVNEAIDHWIATDPLNIYKKVQRDVKFEDIHE